MRQSIPGAASRVNAVALRHLLDALTLGEHTYAELSAITGLHHTTLTRWLSPLRRTVAGNPPLVHIAEWRPDRHGRRNTPAFAWGGRPNARPQPMSNAERQKRARERKRVMRGDAWRVMTDQLKGDQP